MKLKENKFITNDMFKHPQRGLIITILIAILIVQGVALGGCSDLKSVTGSDTLRVGVREGIPGFGYLNKKTGEYYGLEIDLAAKLAEDMGYDDVTYVTVHPGDREKLLKNGKVDCVIATTTITKQRKRNFDFSPAYYEDETVLMVEKSSGFTKISDLGGKTIGIVTGSAARSLVNDKMDKLGAEPVKFYKTTLYKDLDQALETGKIDAVCLDGCVAKAYMNSDRKILDESLMDISYGVMSNKGSELSKQISKSVQKLIDDGTIQKLIDKWN